MITLKLDSLHYGYCDIHGIFTSCEYYFATKPFRHASTKKDLAILAEFRLSQILHLCTRKSVCTTNFGLIGQIGANFPVQILLRTHC